jgi:hypothetical protein
MWSEMWSRLDPRDAVLGLNKRGKGGEEELVNLLSEDL